MAKNNIKSKQGFTIIEVVLVLAIAGLIFLMVFIALPALQRGQRDTQRRNDLSRVVKSVNDYQSLNKTKIPNFDQAFIEDYLKTAGDSFSDPSSGEDYVFYTSKSKTTRGIGECGSTGDNGECSNQGLDEFEAGVIIAIRGATCDGEKAMKTSGNNRYAIIMKLEGAGKACYSN